jgi:adenylate cyclase
MILRGNTVIKKLFRFSGFKLGLLLTIIFCIIKLNIALTGEHASRFMTNLENAFTDLKFVIRGGPETTEELEAFQDNAHVVIAAIDEKSVRMEDLGMWPWPRTKIAQLVSELNRCQAKAIGFDAIFSEPDSSRTAPVVSQILEKYKKQDDKDENFEKDLESVLASVQGDIAFSKVLEELENIVLGYFFFLGEEQTKGLSKEEITEGKERIGFGTVSYVAKHSNTNLEVTLQNAVGVRANLPILTEAAELYGFFNVEPDSDRIFRRVPMLIAMDGNIFPSLSLQMLSAYYDQPVNVLLDTINKEDYFPGYVGIFIGEVGMPTENHIEVPVGLQARFVANFYGKQKTFKHVSVGDIIHRDPKACQDVKDKLVLIGATSTGIYDLRPTPVDSDYPGVELHATVIENQISGDFMVRPVDFILYETLFILFFGIFLSWFLNHFRLTRGLVSVVFIAAGLIVVDYALLFKNGVQAHMLLPVIHLVAMFLGIAVYRYATEEREKGKIRHAFQFYLSKDVINNVLEDTSKLKLGGERRELSILFSDIRGFTTISEKLDPEELTNLLNEYLTPMTDLVFEHEGTLDKYMGDAVMAFYGAPIAFDRHPHAACQTALDMMDELHRLQNNWRERGLPEMDIGIGINTGVVSVGNMGSANRFDYTVLGDHVNLGSRLEGLNKPYGSHIIVSEYTYAAVKDEYTFRELDFVAVKGKKEPVRIYELLHKGQIDPEHDGWIDEFHKGLALYRQQEWDQAIAIFKSLEQDPTSQIYVGRCEDMKANPPGADWDGVLKMTTK